MHRMGVNFGHLASGTAFDVFCDVVLLVWPPIVLL
jgi:hypothetical protein